MPKHAGYSLSLEQRSVLAIFYGRRGPPIFPCSGPGDRVIRWISWLTESLCAARSTIGGAPLTLYTRDRRFVNLKASPARGRHRSPLTALELQVQRVKSFTMADITIETFWNLQSIVSESLAMNHRHKRGTDRSGRSIRCFTLEC